MNEIEIYTQNCDIKNVVDCYYFQCRFRDACKRHKDLKLEYKRPLPIVEQVTLWQQLRTWLQHERDKANDNRYFAHGAAFSSVLDRMFILENHQKQDTNKVG